MLLRVNWAERPIRASSMTSGGGGSGAGGGSKAVSALYVRYSTHKYRHSLTEQNLSQVFNRFGTVEEVRIKESSMDEYTGRQSGYCFIHYPASPEGVQSAFQAVSCMNNAVVDGILFNVEFSKNLLKQIAKNTANNAPISFGYFQRNPPPAQTPIDPAALPMARSGVYRDAEPGYFAQRSGSPRGPHSYPPRGQSYT
ncbi:RNA-binding protein, partial [archaeon]